MKVKNLIGRKGGLYGFMAGMLILLLLFACLPACAPAAEEEEAPPAEAGPYEKYVASLSEGEYPVPQECFEQAREEGELHIYDWAAWWPEDLYTDFEEEFGIKIVRDNFGDFDEARTKMLLHPSIEYDIIQVPPRTLVELRDVGIVIEYNHDWIPNVNKYLKPGWANREWDPGYRYGVPTAMGMDAYSINTLYIDENHPLLPSFAFLFEDPEAYQDKLILRDSMYRVIAKALKYKGYSLNTVDEGELMEARDALMELKPHIMEFSGWPKRQVMADECWVMGGVINDFLGMSKVHDPPGCLVGCMPPEGCFLSPNLNITLTGGPDPAAAHLWNNYLYRPEKFAELIELIGYSYPHSGIDNLISDEVKEWASPDEEWLTTKCEVLEPQAYTGKGEEIRSEIWQELKA